MKYITAFKLFSASALELKGRLLTQLGAFLDRSGGFSDLDEELESIRSVGESWSALTVWALHDGELAAVAKALLSLPASEAAVERTFSAQGLVHTKLRNRLHDATVQKEMFVAFNDGIMSGRQAERRPDVVPVDFMPDVDSDTDVEVEDEEEEEEERKSADEESDDEMEDAPPAADAAAAAAAAAPIRSRSLIVASNEAFIDEFVAAHPESPSWRWVAATEGQLSAAAETYSNLHGIATPGIQNLKAALKKRRH